MIEYLFGIVLGIIYELQPIAETHHTNDEVEISLNENGLSETEDDKPDSPKRRRFALSTIRKRKKLEAEKQEETT